MEVASMINDFFFQGSNGYLPPVTTHQEWLLRVCAQLMEREARVVSALEWNARTSNVCVPEGGKGHRNGRGYGRGKGHHFQSGWNQRGRGRGAGKMHVASESAHQGKLNNNTTENGAANDFFQEPTNAFQQPTNTFQQPTNAFQGSSNTFLQGSSNTFVQGPSNTFQQSMNAFQGPSNAFFQQPNALQTNAFHPGPTTFFHAAPAGMMPTHASAQLPTESFVPDDPQLEYLTWCALNGPVDLASGAYCPIPGANQQFPGVHYIAASVPAEETFDVVLEDNAGKEGGKEGEGGEEGGQEGEGGEEEKGEEKEHNISSPPPPEESDSSESAYPGPEYARSFKVQV